MLSLVCIVDRDLFCHPHTHPKMGVHVNRNTFRRMVSTSRQDPNQQIDIPFTHRCPTAQKSLLTPIFITQQGRTVNAYSFI